MSAPQLWLRFNDTLVQQLLLQNHLTLPEYLLIELVRPIINVVSIAATLTRPNHRGKVVRQSISISVILRGTLNSNINIKQTTKRAIQITSTTMENNSQFRKNKQNRTSPSVVEEETTCGQFLINASLTDSVHLVLRRLTGKIRLPPSMTLTKNNSQTTTQTTMPIRKTPADEDDQKQRMLLSSTTTDQRRQPSTSTSTFSASTSPTPQKQEK